MTTEKKVEEDKKETTIIEVEEDVRIPGTKIILEKGDKVEVLKEGMSVVVTIDYPGVTGSFTLGNREDYSDENMEPVAIKTLEGSLTVNLDCKEGIGATEIQTAIMAFANKFAMKKIK